MLRLLVHLAGFITCAAAGLGLLARFIPPDVLWPPAIIALVLPFLLVGVALYLGGLLWAGHWGKAIFPGLVLLLALPIVRQLWTVNLGVRAAAGPGTKVITVLTANLHNFRDKDFHEVETVRATDFIRRAEPSVLLLQESHLPHNPEPVVSTIKQRSGLAMRHQPDRKSIATYGNGIEFVKDGFAPGSFYNGYLVTDVTTELGKVRVINAHLQSNRISDLAGRIGESDNLRTEVGRAENMFRSYGSAAAKRAEQAEAIRRAVRESPHPVILAGDFNDVPSSYTYRRTLPPRLRDAWVTAGAGLGTTFTGPLPGLRIDYIMVDTAFTVHSIERVETGFSDHLGLQAVLSLH